MQTSSRPLLFAVSAIALVAVSLVTPPALASDQRRMGPAQRLLHDGAQPSQRDLARSRVRGASAIRTRGSTFDEVLSARESSYWQTKTRNVRSGKKRAVRKRRK
jgi:hypothetical protein